MPHQALLCDLDGTLVDTEPQHRAAWLKSLKRDYGLVYSEEWFEQWVGTSDRTLAASVIEEHDLDATIDELSRAKQELFHREVAAGVEIFPGAAAELTRINGRFPLAIATNSGRADTDKIIPAARLDRFTEIVVTATDVEHIKPAPDIYLLAAERLGVAATDCIAIEDSAPGGQAAKAAGCYLIGLNDAVDMADETVTNNAAALARARRLLEENHQP